MPFVELFVSILVSIDDTVILRVKCVTGSLELSSRNRSGTIVRILVYANSMSVSVVELAGYSLVSICMLWMKVEKPPFKNTIQKKWKF